MKFRFPLYAKILLWLLVNMMMLIGVSYVFFRAQFKLGLDSLLLGASGERLEAVGKIIEDELGNNKRQDWDQVLARFTNAYRVEFALYRPDGYQLAGGRTKLPPEVLAKMRMQGRPRPGGGEAPPPAGEGPEDGDSFHRRPLAGPGERPPPEGEFGRPPRPQPGTLPKFLVRTAYPTRYWAGVRVAIPDPDPNLPRRMPAVLLALSNSLSGGGLFVDYTPWLLVAAGVVGLSVLLWTPMVRGITRSVSQITAATERIAEGNFDVQVPQTRADELGRLALAVNRLAGRLAGFVTGQKRFLGDIAHELCSPLARAEMGLSILAQRVDPVHLESVEDVREEVRLMSNLVNELLSFSKAGLAAKNLKLADVELAPLIERAILREGGRVDSVTLDVPRGLRAKAEPELLSRAMGNLVRNALRYAGGAGVIRVKAEGQGGKVEISVIDQGPGVSEEAISKLGEPFYRPEAARTREGGGVGLGLAIVRTCVEACRGSLTLRNSEPKGFEARICLEACDLP